MIFFIILAHISLFFILLKITKVLDGAIDKNSFYSCSVSLIPFIGILFGVFFIIIGLYMIFLDDLKLVDRFIDWFNGD